jgi:ATP-dependent exoDNAse (exonuclease V) beta subunit
MELAMKQYLSRLDEVVREINRWLLAIAIGLALLDLTVICALHATDLAILARDAGRNDAAERIWGASREIDVVPNWF